MLAIISSNKIIWILLAVSAERGLVYIKLSPTVSMTPSEQQVFLFLPITLDRTHTQPQEESEVEHRSVFLLQKFANLANTKIKSLKTDAVRCWKCTESECLRQSQAETILASHPKVLSAPRVAWNLLVSTPGIDQRSYNFKRKGAIRFTSMRYKRLSCICILSPIHVYS